MTADSTNPPSTHGPAPSADVFATTHWSLVLAAGANRAPQPDLAMEELCRTYWYPLYAYIRHQGHSRQDAEDLTQGFFARFLARNYLKGLRSDKGRFRAFLLAALKHFLANERDRAASLKRGGGVPALSLDWKDAASRYQIEPANQLSPDKLYDRAWAVTLLERVIQRLRDESATDGKAEWFDQLKPFLMMDRTAMHYGQAAAALGLTPGAARVTVHRLRKRYREVLRQEIARTLSHPAQVDEEMRTLFSAFS